MSRGFQRFSNQWAIPTGILPTLFHDMADLRIIQHTEALSNILLQGHKRSTKISGYQAGFRTSWVHPRNLTYIGFLAVTLFIYLIGPSINANDFCAMSHPIPGRYILFHYGRPSYPAFSPCGGVQNLSYRILRSCRILVLFPFLFSVACPKNPSHFLSFPLRKLLVG